MHYGGLGLSIIMSIGPAEQLLKINSFLKWKGKEPLLIVLLSLSSSSSFGGVFFFLNLGGGALAYGQTL